MNCLLWCIFSIAWFIFCFLLHNADWKVKVSNWWLKKRLIASPQKLGMCLLEVSKCHLFWKKNFLGNNEMGFSGIVSNSHVFWQSTSLNKVYFNCSSESVLVYLKTNILKCFIGTVVSVYVLDLCDWLFTPVWDAALGPERLLGVVKLTVSPNSGGMQGSKPGSLFRGEYYLHWLKSPCVNKCYFFNKFFGAFYAKYRGETPNFCFLMFSVFLCVRNCCDIAPIDLFSALISIIFQCDFNKISFYNTLFQPRQWSVNWKITIVFWLVWWWN